MLSPKSALNEAVPPVDPKLLQRLWIAQSEHGNNSTTSYTLRAITEVCGSSTTDPVAIWARAALIAFALQAGAINYMVQDGMLPQAVFDAAATIPIPEGLEAFDFDHFVATLT